MTRILDEVPTPLQVADADACAIVDWHLHLRPPMSNAELDVVKAITRRYDALSASERERWGRHLRRSAQR